MNLLLEVLIQIIVGTITLVIWDVDVNKIGFLRFLIGWWVLVGSVTATTRALREDTIGIVEKRANDGKRITIFNY